ncbi:ABC transporter ATP-binding protein [Methanooceanicella nereidis]|uniref:ABC transporter ATP-binding protein n=1 Tax=Methanooceanicella nereidis TaxID=2052831 RepID=UPI001E46D256
MEAHGLVKYFGSVKALDNFEMSVRKNTVHGLVGPNGSGKSTIIRILSADLKPDSGDVTILGVPVSSVREIRSMVSLVPELSAIPDRQSPKKIFEKAGRSARLHREEIQYRISVLSEILELDSLLDRNAGELSLGMRRRLCLGLSLIKDSSVLLMDGSLAELDPGFCVKFMEVIREQNDKTVVLTANNMSVIDRVCDGVTIIRDGTTLLNESVMSIRHKIGKPAVTIKVSPINRAKLEAALRQQMYVNNLYTGEDSIIVEVDDIIHIPVVIRHAAAHTEIYEARQTMTGIEDLYHTFIGS